MIKNPKQIASFLPGTIIEIKTEVGKKVNKGEILVIFDAMKMYNRIVSPIDGTIKSINISVGDKIPKDFVMIELD